MKWGRWISGLLLVLLLAVPALLLHRLLYTQQGLDYVLARLQGLQSVRIEVSGARGVIAGPVSFRHVVVDHDAVRVEADEVRGTLELADLLAGRLAVSDASIARVEVTLKDRGPQPETELHFLPRFLTIVAPDLRVRRAGVRLKGGYRLHIESLLGSARLTRWRLDVDPFTIEDPAGRITGKVFLRAMNPLGLRGEASGEWRLPDERSYVFSANVRGNLDRLGVDAALTRPARLAFAGTVLGLTHDARAVGTVRAVDFDGSPWVPANRLPPLSGSIAVDAGHDGIGIDGTLTSPAFGAEPVRVHGSGRYAAQQLDVIALKAWLPRSTLSLTTAGTVRFAEHAPQLRLAGKWTALRWPLSGNVIVESPAGSYQLTGGLPYAFELEAQVRGPQLPVANFTAAGSIDREQLVLDRVQGAVLSGQLNGSGRLSWAGEQPWRVQLNGRALDVAGLRKDLNGRVDIVGEFEGRGFAAGSPWTARLASLSGTLFGRALTGSGEITHRSGAYDLKRIRVANAGSHVDLDGRWGPSVDLRWNADLAALSLLDPSLAGELVSTGTAVGSRARPQVQGSAHARHLRAGGVSADSIDAELDVDLADGRDSRADVRVSGMSAGGLQFAAVHVLAKGRTSDHRITLTATSSGNQQHRIAGFEATLAVAGSADLTRRSWQGLLNEASFDFPDGGARLAQPAALDLGPTLVRSAPLCLETGESHLCVEGEWRGAPQSWRVIFSAQDWPLRRLLSTLLGRREFDGKLQASGWAEQQPGHDWVGGAALLLDHPTIDIRRNKFRSDRVEIGSGRLDVFADEDEIRAETEFEMAASTQLRGRASVRRQRGQPLADSPLSGEIRAESAVLTALPLFVPEIDRSEGRMDASVRLGGLLGDPRFDGDFHLRDGRLDLYRTNLSLTGASLDGHFVGDTLEFDGRATSRKGPVTLQGSFSWPEGVMTGSMRLTGDGLLVADTPEYRVQASPDLKISAGAGNYTVTGEVLIPSARIAPKDLSTSVRASDDERIIGEEVEESAPATLQRVHSNIRVVLGEDVRVETYGLKARLGGEVTVTTAPGEQARGTGAIKVLDGEYKAFGVYVKILRGVLSYQDAPLTRPTLDLVAQREIKDEDVKVAVNVRGQLDSPFITLTSEPAMPQNEALSYLLTGRSINTLQSNEAASVNRAAESLAVSGGGLLLGGLGSRIGLDEVAVESTGSKDTQVVLGKFLSPKLFVSYGISVAEAINTIKLRYTLNPRWSLRAEAGLAQSADVEFRIER